MAGLKSFSFADAGIDDLARGLYSAAELAPESASNSMDPFTREKLDGRLPILRPQAGRMELWRARFADPTLERGFRADSLRWTRRFLRALCVLGLAGAALTLHASYLTGLHRIAPEAFAAGAALRVALGVVCVALLFGFHRLKLQGVSVMTSALYALSCAVLALRMSETPPADAEYFTELFFISRDGMTAFLSITLAVLMLAPGGFLHNAVTGLIALGFYLFLFQYQGEPQFLRLAYATGIAGGVILSISYAVQRLRRQYYLAHVRLSESNRLLARLASTDELTGAVNRRRFFELAHQEWERSVRYRHPLTVAVFDVDRFKKINDRYGHPTGDEALRRIAETVRDHIRSSDVFARLGGEEFALLLPETDSAHALRLAERLRESIAALDVEVETENETRRVRISASFGVAERIASDHEPEHMLVRADRALYAAKNAGRNQVVPAE